MPEEKILTVNLSAAVKKTRVERAPYASSLLKKDVAKRTGAKEVKIGAFLNKAIWSRGAKKPPSSVRIKAVVDEGVAKVELFGHEYVEFRAKSVAKKEKMLDKLRAHMSPKEQQKEELEKKIEGIAEEGTAQASEGHSGSREPKGPEAAGKSEKIAREKMPESADIRKEKSTAEKAKTDTKKQE